MTPIVRVIGLAALAASLSAASDPPSFDVASVRPNKTGRNGGSTSRSGGRVALENVSLREAIGWAYQIPEGRDYALSGPAWLASEKFDIVATCPSETPPERVREMLQTLLAERFGLRTHRENKKLTAYALVAAKWDRLSTLSSARSAPAAEESLTWGEGKITARAMSMSSFADRLSGPIFKLNRPVMDMTGITGAFDFTLKWAPDGPHPDGNPGPSIFTALQEQLGLKLETREATVSILVVDHAERVPTGN